MNGTEDHDRFGKLIKRAMPDDLPEDVQQRLRPRLTAFQEQFDAAADRGLREVQQRARAGEAAAADDRDERRDLVDLHGDQDSR